VLTDVCGSGWCEFAPNKVVAVGRWLMFSRRVHSQTASPVGQPKRPALPVCLVCLCGHYPLLLEVLCLCHVQPEDDRGNVRDAQRLRILPFAAVLIQESTRSQLNAPEVTNAAVGLNFVQPHDDAGAAREGSILLFGTARGLLPFFGLAVDMGMSPFFGSTVM